VHRSLKLITEPPEPQLVPLHEPRVKLHVRDPVAPIGLQAPGDVRHGEQLNEAKQVEPEVGVQARISPVVVAIPLQAPIEQTCGVQPRYCVPVPTHCVSVKQMLHGVQLGVPQLIPSLSRVHGCVSTVIIRSQTPPLQVGMYVFRLWVPLSPHSPMNPAHVPNGSDVAAPQLSPSVERAQPAVSLSARLAMPPHTPPAQIGVVIVRILVALSSQGSA
jgi:hypothetical protein